MKTLHVTFGSSAAGSLREALAHIGRDEPVRALPDDLGVGPIAPPMTGESRVDWCLGAIGEDHEVIADLDAFWAEVADPDLSIVAWMSSRSVRELSGLLALVSRRDAGLRVIDVAHVPFVGRDGQPRPMTGQSFGFVRHDQIVGHRLLDQAAPLSPEQLSRHRAAWARLEREDADLRVLGETGLLSVPLTHFDDVIRACVTSEWQRCALVVGEAWNAASPGPYYQASDAFVWFRLLELIDAGAFEGDGDLARMHESRVRRRPAE